jgi:hypothetical protein
MSALIYLGEEKSLPGHNSRERTITSSYTEEYPEVLHSRGSVGDVDRKANKAHNKPCKDERRAHPVLVRVVGEYKDDDGW